MQPSVREEGQTRRRLLEDGRTSRLKAELNDYVVLKAFLVENVNDRQRDANFVKEIAEVLSNIAAEVNGRVVVPLFTVRYSSLLETKVMKAHIRGARGCRRIANAH